MPANLTPEFYRAEEAFRKASSLNEKLDALKKMLAAIPKHKGTEKMQADLKKRIAALREEIQKSGKKKASFSFKVEKEGGGQVAVVGPPNSGKTQLVSTLAGIDTLEVADYPFTTRKPHPAMMPYEDIQIQLVDLPPISSQHMEFWVPNIIRSADMILLAIDLADPAVLDLLEESIHILKEHKIEPVNYMPEEDYWASVVKKRTWLVGTKLDLPDAADNWEIIKEAYFDQFGLSAVSAVTGENIERLRTEIFQALEIIRVYSKPPGKDPDMSQPFTLPKGSNLLDFANKVHRDFGERLRYARLWGHGKFEGQRIMRDYILHDRDIVELHL